MPEGLAADVRVGSMVRVPFHGRRVAGWVVADHVSPPPGVALRPLLSVTGHGPPPDVVELTSWAAWRWAGRRATFLRSASPPRVVRALPAPALPARPGGAPSAGGAGGPGGDMAAEALSSGRAVVRLPPAADAWPVVARAAALGDALLLAPSVAEAAALARRLRDAGFPVALLPGEWARAAAGGCSAVGSRAAAWGPVPRLAAAVVLDAHDEVYQEQRAPTWNAWQVAAERARRAGAPCALVSPCPNLEQLAWGRLVVPSRRDEREGWPPLEVADRRADDPRRGLYSEPLVRLLRSGAGVACILNRKGRSRLLACTACTDLARCEACQGAMEQRSAAGNLTCRRCGAARAVVCQSCGSSRLKTVRVGVSRVREELEALANVAVGEVTGDSGEIPGAAVLVGTDALLHRLRPGARRAVAFLDFDQELLAPRYRAAEQALALLARAARLVGGRGAGGRILVQTRIPGHEVLAAALNADPDRVPEAEARRRVELRFPPAAALARVSGPAAGAFVAALPPAVERLGPDAGAWLLRAPDHTVLCDALAATPRPAGRLRLEVDPLRI